MQQVLSLPPGQTAPSTIIVNYQRQKKSKTKPHFKASISMRLGILLICCAGLLIILQAVGVYIQLKKEDQHHFYYSGNGQMSFSGIWTAPLILLAGTFAIVASKTKRTGFIITALVFSVLSAVFSVPVAAFSAWVIADEEIEVVPHEISYHYRHESTWPPVVIQLRKSNQGVAILMLVLALTEFVASIILSVLCCRVVCCGAKRSEDIPDPGQVLFLNAASGSHHSVSRIEPSGYTPPQSFTGFMDPSMCAKTTIPTEMGEATGGELPPSYSMTELHKAGVGESDLTGCPAKVPL